MKTKVLTAIIAFFAVVSLYAQQVPLQHTQLPQEAKTFLKEHFTSGFHHAMKFVDKRVIIYDVFLDNDTEIKFSESGKWIEVDGKNNAIPVSYIQKQILDYIRINHPKETINKMERSDTGYTATLSKGIGLRFDAIGTFTKLD